jgi:hypothetical protein
MSEDLTILKGDGTWPWSAHIDGDDIVFEGEATAFGGSNDPEDNGQTASGISTKNNPKLEACALPRCYTGKNKSVLAALGGSPIPAGIPFRTRVRITCGDVSFVCPFIDLGPAKSTGHVIDLTQAAARRINSKATTWNFCAHVQARILGGARYAQATYPAK